MLSSLFDACQQRQDVLQGDSQEADFAADPQRFFANTDPTRGLKNLLRSVCLRLSERPDQIGARFRLDTQFGGGKTHSRMALRFLLSGAGN